MPVWAYCGICSMGEGISGKWGCAEWLQSSRFCASNDNLIALDKVLYRMEQLFNICPVENRPSGSFFRTMPGGDEA